MYVRKRICNNTGHSTNTKREGEDNVAHWKRSPDKPGKPSACKVAKSAEWSVADHGVGEVSYIVGGQVNRKGGLNLYYKSE